MCVSWILRCGRISATPSCVLKIDPIKNPEILKTNQDSLVQWLEMVILPDAAVVRYLTEACAVSRGKNLPVPATKHSNINKIVHT